MGKRRDARKTQGQGGYSPWSRVATALGAGSIFASGGRCGKATLTLSTNDRPQFRLIKGFHFHLQTACVTLPSQSAYRRF